AKFRRLVSRLQEIAILPLDVVDDPSAVETTVQANRNEPRLARHEASPLDHKGQSFGLFSVLRLNDRDLSYGLIFSSNLWHGAPPIFGAIKLVRHQRTFAFSIYLLVSLSRNSWPIRAVWNRSHAWPKSKVRANVAGAAWILKAANRFGNYLFW